MKYTDITDGRTVPLFHSSGCFCRMNLACYATCSCWELVVVDCEVFLVPVSENIELKYPGKM